MAATFDLPYKLYVDRDAGVISYQWEPLARITVSPTAVPSVAWNRNCVADIGVELSRMQEVAQTTFQPKVVSRSG